MSSEAGMGWTEVLTHLRTHYSTTRESNEAIRLELPSAGKQQTIVVLRSDVAGQAGLTLVAKVGTEAALPMRTALEHCATLLAGALVLRDGVYLFRHSMSFVSLTSTSLDAMVRYVATEAARVPRLPTGFSPVAFDYAI